MDTEERVMIAKNEAEFKAISIMLDRSKKYGLQTEVIWSFAESLKAGERDIPSAAASALCEWDV